MAVQISLVNKDFEGFKSWLGLNWEGVTWQGRYEADFQKFWDLFYVNEITIKQLAHRYEIAKIKMKSGPIVSWVSWLEEKHIVYLFISNDFNIFELSEQFNKSCSDIGYIIRNFFVEKFPHQEEYFSDILHIGNMFSEGQSVRFAKFKKDLNLPEGFTGAIEDEILNNLEVTLFEDWYLFIEYLSKLSKKEDKTLVRERRKKVLNLYGIVFRDVLILFSFVALMVKLIMFGNQWYDEYLFEKIKTFADFFSSSDHLVKEKSVSKVKQKKLNFELKEIKEFEAKQERFLAQENIERYAIESDIMLSSMENVPQDFQKAAFDDPTKKEDKGGFRDETFGRKKVYRVMIKTESSKLINDKIKTLIKKFDGESVGENEKLERIVPGGVYYNLYIPKEYENEFLSEASTIKESMILPSKNRKLPPPGKSKIFIWVKEI